MNTAFLCALGALLLCLVLLTAFAAVYMFLSRILKSQRQIAESLERPSDQDALSSVRSSCEELQRKLGRFSDEFRRETGASEARSNMILETLRSTVSETQNLCNTLRGKAKVQGTWGEEMLERILESAGLVKGVHFEEQRQVTDVSGKKLYPDVVIRLTGGRNLVVDSKVSLEQFLKSNEEENVSRQKQALKAHATSVRFHVSELVSKDYQHLLENSLDYVIMFMPHEGAFQAAISEDPGLLSWAYSQGVIIVNPSNLMTTLLLVKNMWQQDERAREVEKINEAALKLYGKFVSFAKNFEKLESHLHKLQATYDSARSQLSSGPGNIVKQLSDWEEKYGIRTSETIPESLK